MRITPRLRKRLKSPLGEVVKDLKGLDPKGEIIAIGDEASKSLIREGFEPKAIVYDGKTKREDIGVSADIQGYPGTQYTIKNPQGGLETEVFDLFRKILAKEGISKVYVEGEEDLTALAAILAAKSGSTVLYGQPNEGIVVVEVDEKIKKEVQNMIEEMEDGC